jgi:hypothetical protein
VCVGYRPHLHRDESNKKSQQSYERQLDELGAPHELRQVRQRGPECEYQSRFLDRSKLRQDTHHVRDTAVSEIAA